MPENGLLDDASTPLLRRAVELLDGVFDALVVPARWCRGAYAKDAEGERIEGRILDAVEGREVASRCMLGELLHQGLARGYRIEVATESEPADQSAVEVRHAAASWWLAALACDRVAWGLNEEHARRNDELLARYPSPEPDPPGRIVLWLTSWNDTATHEEAITCVVLAAQMLRAELNRRAKGGAR